jgi:hypothetical protein
MASRSKSLSVPEEFEGVARFTKDITVLEEHVNKCYSAERYEDFQAAVEKIIARYIKQVLVWGALVWIASLIVSMIAEKFLHLF